MAKVRWRHRCTGRSSRTGQPCKAWAIRGGNVCRSHGGSAPAVRQAATVRLIQQRFERGFQVSWRAYEERLHAWRVERIVTTAELMDMRPEDVRWPDMVACRALHGRPDSIDAEPQFRWDERYGPRH